MIAGVTIHFAYWLLEHRNKNIDADAGNARRKGFVRRVFSAEKARIVRAERLLPLDTEKRYTYSDSIGITGAQIRSLGETGTGQRYEGGLVGLQGKHRNIEKGVTYIGTQRECGLHTQGMSGGCEGYRICDGGSCPFYGKAGMVCFG